uniref:Porphobilinogen deaminase n=1 Tax=Mizugakiibacter sediminis TaxID=1475481 RepID=A0A0U1P9E7_9GAMM
MQELLAPLEDADTRRATAAERAMNEALGGSCTVPVAAWAVLGERGLALYGLVGDAARGRLLRAHAEGEAPAALGRAVAMQLFAQGAAEFLEAP